VLFLLSYGLMTLLIVEQGTTIQSQRSLIQQLLGDSTELSALKSKAIEEQHAQAQAEAEAQAQVETPADATQTSPVETPSTQAVPSGKTSAAHKAQRPAPALPPVPASDIADARRTLMSI
jgi:hypothetical protein